MPGMPSISLPLHLLSSITTLQTGHYVITAHNRRIHHTFGSHFQYLTNIALLLSLFTFVVSLVHNILSTVTHSPVLDRLRRILRFTTAPLELTIAMVYWPLYVLNPGLLADRRTLPPLYWDIGLHLLPAVFLVLDFVVLPPRKRLRLDSRVASLFFAVFLGLYWMWLVECHTRNGFWAYPILERVGVGVKSIMYMVAVGVLCGARELVVGWTLRDA